MTQLIIIILLLLIACVLLMRSFVDQKTKIETLNEKLNLSDAEYIDLFKENIKLSDKITELKVIKLIKK